MCLTLQQSFWSSFQKVGWNYFFHEPLQRGKRFWYGRGQRLPCRAAIGDAFPFLRKFRNSELSAEHLADARRHICVAPLFLHLFGLCLYIFRYPGRQVFQQHLRQMTNIRSLLENERTLSPNPLSSFDEKLLEKHMCIQQPMINPSISKTNSHKTYQAKKIRLWICSAPKQATLCTWRFERLWSIVLSVCPYSVQLVCNTAACVLRNFASCLSPSSHSNSFSPGPASHLKEVFQTVLFLFNIAFSVCFDQSSCYSRLCSMKCRNCDQKGL